MKIFSCLLSVIVFTAFAQDSTITVKLSDLEKIAPGSSGALKAVVAAQTAEQLLDKRVAQYGKWVGLGREIGTAVRECLEALNGELVKLAETKIGKVAIFLVIWKVLFSDVVGLVIGIPTLIGWTILFIWIMKRCFMAQVMTFIEQGEKIERLINDDWDDEKWAALAVAGAVYLIVSALLLGCVIL